MSAAKRKLSLTNHIRYHMFSVIVLSICTLYLINKFITHGLTLEIDTPEKISIILICFALAVFWKKDNDLKYETFQTNLSIDDLKLEIEKLANQFDWVPVSSSKFQYEFKIKISSHHSLNTISFPREEKRYLNARINAYPGQFQLNIILDLDSGILDGVGEKKQWKNKIINTLKSTT